MGNFGSFVELGFRHITDVTALDHVLFLVALAAIYTRADWKAILWVVSAFTIGHSVTLALAVTGAVRLPAELIEFLIPATIVVTCAENLFISRDRLRSAWHRPLLAGVFGLVHGAGFANYLRNIFPDQIGVPLFGFNVGIEAGQLTVLALLAIAFAAADWMIGKAGEFRLPTVRLRAIAVSSVVMVIAGVWAVQRSPW